MGRGIYEGSPRTERIQLATYSSDPTNPSDIEAWLRTDLTGTDKVGEFRFWDGASVQAVDVVTPGSTDADTEEVLRVQTPNGLGVIPTLPRGDSKHPEFTLQHNGQAMGLGVPEIPTNGLAHLYEFEDAADTSTAVDSVGSADGTITGATYDDSLSYAGSYSLAYQSGDYVEVGTEPFAHNSLTVTAWVWVPSEASNGDIRVWGTQHTQGSDYELRTFSNTIIIPINGTLVQESPGSLSSDAWNYFSFSLSYDSGADETDVIVQINGEQSSSTHNGSFNQADITAYLGAWTDGSATLLGNSDQNRFYDRGLSAEELDNIYRAE